MRVVRLLKGGLAASKVGLQALPPNFPSPSFCLAPFAVILTVEPGPRLLDTGRIVVIIIIIITYLTRVNLSAEAVINGFPVQLTN